MLSTWFPTEGDRRNVTGETTFLIDRTLTKQCDAFVNYAGDFPEQGTPRHLARFGTSFRLTPEQQLDLHFGVVFRGPRLTTSSASATLFGCSCAGNSGAKRVYTSTRPTAKGVSCAVFCFFR